MNRWRLAIVVNKSSSNLSKTQVMQDQFLKMTLASLYIVVSMHFNCFILGKNIDVIDIDCAFPELSMCDSG